ncbi:CD9 antigen-like [Hoplias malabaricus]|uniref:CD9 antigen-like n=1 Tax=Hoplias malabaricus TaxID=27720 RepID=UPI003463025A
MSCKRCGQMCKILLIIFNMLFLLVGLAMLCGGLYLRFSAEEPTSMDYHNGAVNAVIVVGTLLLVAAIIGVSGSYFENKHALVVYSCLLSSKAILAVIAGVLSSVYIQKFSSYVVDFYTTIYSQFQTKKDFIRSIILLVFHYTFDCCGLGDSQEILMQKNVTCTHGCSVLGISVSNSTNCTAAILKDLQVSSVLGGFFGISVALLLPLVCSVVMCCNLRNRFSYPRRIDY